MTSNAAAAPVGFKKKAENELKEYAFISLYLAFVLCAISTYTMLVLRRYEVSYWTYGTAIINALIVAKIILIGRMAHLGRQFEARPLYQSVLYKSLAFGLLLFVFHVVEEVIKRLVHHHSVAGVIRDIDTDQMMARTIIVICAFVPLFAWTELRRVMGEDKLHALFFKRGATSDSAFSATESRT
jgi:hypothetical protein